MTSMYLGQFLQAPLLRTDSLLGAAKHFERLGGLNYAREILLNAYNRNTASQTVLTNLVDLEIDTGNAADLGVYLNRLLQMRRPSVITLEKAYNELSSDRFLFTPNREVLLVDLKAALHRSEKASASDTSSSSSKTETATTAGSQG